MYRLWTSRYCHHRLYHISWYFLDSRDIFVPNCVIYQLNMWTSETLFDRAFIHCTQSIVLAWHKHHGLSNHDQIYALFKSLFKLMTKNKSKPCITDHFQGSPSLAVRLLQKNWISYMFDRRQWDTTPLWVDWLIALPYICFNLFLLDTVT